MKFVKPFTSFKFSIRGRTLKERYRIAFHDPAYLTILIGLFILLISLILTKHP